MGGPPRRLSRPKENLKQKKRDANLDGYIISQRYSLRSVLCLVSLFLSLAMAHAAAAPSRRRSFSLARTRVAALLRLCTCIAVLCARIATVVKLSARACSGTLSLSRARNVPGCIWGPHARVLARGSFVCAWLMTGRDVRIVALVSLRRGIFNKIP